MALLPCPECAREISTRAATCPHCGCPVRETLVAEARQAGAPPEVLHVIQPAPGPQGTQPASSTLGRCATCGSDDVRRLSVVYEAETHHVTSRSRTSGVGMVGGGIGIASATTVTEGLRQAMLAQRIAPPQPQDETAVGGVVAILVLLLVVTGVVAVNFGATGMVSTLVVGFIVFAGCSLGGVFVDARKRAYNRQALPRLRATWERSVVCMRCGAVTDPEAAG